MAKKRTSKRLNKAILIIIGLYIMIASSLYLLQEKILFRPTVLAQDYQFQFANNFKEVFLKTDKDAVINALHFKNENPKGIILYFHGNAGDLQRWGEITEYFVNKNYDVFVMDYRTYGKSSGALNEQALYNDAAFCYKFISETYKEENITVYGRSLGATFATYVASKNKPKQLILETPFFNVLDVAKSRFPIFPVKQLLKYNFQTNKYIKNVSCKIAIIHGTDDSVVPYESGKKLFLTSLKNQTTLTTILGASHNNLIEFEEYHTKINEILP